MDFSFLSVFLVIHLNTLECVRQKGPFADDDPRVTLDEDLEAALKFEIDFDGLEAANKRHKHVVVYNVREKKKENISATVEKLGLKLGFEHPLDHVVYAYRSEVPIPYKPGKPRTIVIHMHNKTLKTAWAKAYEKKRLYRGNWYLYADLPRDVFVLHQETEIWAHKKKYSQVVHSTFDVYYRKTNDTKAFKVIDLEHLHHLYTNESYYEFPEEPVVRNSTHRLNTLECVPFPDKDLSVTRGDKLEAAIEFKNDFASLDAANKRHKYVVVNNLREPKNENISATVEEIGLKLGFEHPLDHVVYAYRSEVPKPYQRGKRRTIVIHLHNKTLKNAWAKAYEDKELYGGTWYVYADLPRDVSVLNQETERWANKKNYAQVMHSTFDVYYRKTNGTKAFKVIDLEHLHHLYTNESYYEFPEEPVMRNSTQYLASIKAEAKNLKYKYC
ncbi:hypothetical protein WDU94_005840 [Cyamophila willieti]